MSMSFLGGSVHNMRLIMYMYSCYIHVHLHVDVSVVYNKLCFFPFQDEVTVPGYHIYWHSAEQKGYSGVG